jgi:hypothetical protein
MLCFLSPDSFASAENETRDSDTADKQNQYSAHEYVVLIRPTLWLVFVEGEYRTEARGGQKLSLTIDGDLGYNDPYPTFSGEVNFRWGKHDFSIIGMPFYQSESESVHFAFTLGESDFEIGGVAKTKVSLADVNFRYGYSFFDFEEDGFRLGPTLAISYTDFSIEVTELTIAGAPTGLRASYADTLPIPTLGIHAELPYGSLLFSSELGAFYFDSGNFEGLGIRASAGLSWRPYDHVGLFAGFRTIYIDLELKRDVLDDVVLWGPTVGLEFRF